MKIPWPPSLNYKKVVFILAFMVLFLSHTCHPVELNQIQSNQAEKMLISFDESLKSPEQCPKMIPKYFGNVQPRGKYIAEKNVASLEEQTYYVQIYKERLGKKHEDV